MGNEVVQQASMLDLILAQLAILLMVAGGNERLMEFITAQVELRLKYKLSGGAIQFISVVTGIVLCFIGSVVLIPSAITASLGVELNVYANYAMAGAVVGLGSGLLHDIIGLLRQLKDYFKGANVYASGTETKRTGKF